MNPDFEPRWPEDLSDEAAVVLCTFLQDLELACENRYAVQLRRYHAAPQTDLFDPEQPWRKRPTDG